MKTVTDSLLSLTSRVSERLSPVMFLADSIFERLAPKAVAKACSGHICFSECIYSSCPNGYYKVVEYATSGTDCSHVNECLICGCY